MHNKNNFVFALLLIIICYYSHTTRAAHEQDDHKGRKFVCFACSQGIGLATAELMVGAGAHVVINSRTREKLDNAIKLLKDKYPGAVVHGIEGDCAMEADIKRVIEESAKILDGIDTLFYNPTFGGSLGYTEKHFAKGILNDLFDKQVLVNVKGLMWAVVYGLDALTKSKNFPSVIATTSVAANVPQLGNAYYALAKAAEETLIKNYALEFAHYGIRFLAVSPGCIDTPTWEVAGPEIKAYAFEQLAPTHMLNRIGRAEEIATVVGFLASSRASFMTGAIIPVDAGSSQIGAMSKAFVPVFGPIPDRVKGTREPTAEEKLHQVDL